MSQIVKNKLKSTPGSILEHWTGESKEALIGQFSMEQMYYPTLGYGTSLSKVRQDPTGLLWHGEFFRYTSCD